MVTDSLLVSISLVHNDTMLARNNNFPIEVHFHKRKPLRYHREENLFQSIYNIGES